MSDFKIKMVTNPDLPEPKCVVLAGPHGVGQAEWKPLNEVKPEGAPRICESGGRR